METTRFLKIVIIALLVLNTATLAYMWLQGGPGGHRPPPRETPFDFLTRELKLDRQQVQQYADLRDEHHSKVVELRRESGQLRRLYFDNMYDTTIDSARVLAMADSIAGIQKEIELVTFYHFKQVRSICTPKQQERFDEVIDEALRMMGPPPRGEK